MFNIDFSTKQVNDFVPMAVPLVVGGSHRPLHTVYRGASLYSEVSPLFQSTFSSARQCLL